MKNIKNSGVLAMVFVLAASSAAAESFKFQPDAKVTIAGRDVPVDFALLGDHCEETAGFYASLDTDHGPAFGLGWTATYNWLADVRSSNRKTVQGVKTHIQAHGDNIKGYELAAAQARKVCLKNPALLHNTP